jgi:WD40 repeat protein/predicted Ser/Thr protein kinase
VTSGASTTADFASAPSETADFQPGQGARVQSASPTDERAPAGFVIEKELGRGGMGVVYLARHTRLDRLCALKMILAAEHADSAQRERFDKEAQAIARLQHENIVRVFEIGEHNQQPFMALEFCEGGSLDKKLRTQQPTPREAATLVRTLALGMQAAHEARVIHRDLKPGNILLAADGTPKVTDFGLARKLDEDGATRTGVIAGTPSYMPPEQARGDKELGPAVDIWALGAILYECLTGRPPFKAATSMETLRQVLDNEPVAVQQLNPSVPRDLETICLKCLQKDPRRRYGSARELAADLGRFLNGEPIVARPVGTIERAVKWVKRNRVVSLLAAAILLVLTAGVGVSSYFAAEAINKAALAGEKEQEARTNEANANREAAVAKARARQAEDARHGMEIDRGLTALERNDLPGTLDALDRMEPRYYDAWETVYLRNLVLRQTQQPRALISSTVPVASLCFSPDGKRLVSGGGGFDNFGKPLPGELKLWDAVTGQELLTFKGHTLPVTSVCFSPDGQRVLSGSADQPDPAGGPPGEVKLWDASTGRELLSFQGHKGRVASVSFSPDGKRVLSGGGIFGKPGELKVWDTVTGQEVFSLTGHTFSVTSATFSPDGKRIASASGTEGATPGKRLPGEVKVWDTETGEELLTLRGYPGQEVVVCFSLDSKRIISGSGGAPGRPAEIKVSDAATGREVFPLKGLQGRVLGVSYSPDGQRIFALGDSRGKLWDAESGQEKLALKGTTRPVVWSPDGKRIVSPAKVWDAETGRLKRTLLGHAELVYGVSFSPDGQRILSGSADKTAKVWDLETGREIHTLTEHTDQVHSIAWSPDGKRVATGSHDNTVKLWDATTGQEIRTFQGHTHWVYDVCFSPDGQRLLSGSGDGTVKLWDAETGQVIRSIQAHPLPVPGGPPLPVTCVSFSPDGQRILTGSIDRTAKVWDLATGTRRLTLKGHAGELWSVAWSPDGQRIVTGSGDKTVRVWDAEGQLKHTLQGHTGDVRSVRFSPDSQRVVSGSSDRTAKVWDAGTGQELFTLQGHTVSVHGVGFSPDGQLVLSGSGDRTVKVWDATGK